MNVEYEKLTCDTCGRVYMNVKPYLGYFRTITVCSECMTSLPRTEDERIEMLYDVDIDPAVKNNPEEADKWLVSLIAADMDRRLTQKREQGYTGWNTKNCTNDILNGMLLSSLSKHNMLDVAIVASMIHIRKNMFTDGGILKNDN